MIKARMNLKDLATKFNGVKIPDTGRYQFTQENAREAVDYLNPKWVLACQFAQPNRRYTFSFTSEGVLMITTPKKDCNPEGWAEMGRLCGMETDIVIEPCLYRGEYDCP